MFSVKNFVRGKLLRGAALALEDEPGLAPLASVANTAIDAARRAEKDPLVRILMDRGWAEDMAINYAMVLQVLGEAPTDYLEQLHTLIAKPELVLEAIHSPAFQALGRFARAELTTRSSGGSVTQLSLEDKAAVGSAFLETFTGVEETPTV